MKTTVFLLFSLAVLFSLALFYNYSNEKSVVPADSPDKMFSTLVDDESYRYEFMKIMKTKYPAEIVTTAFSISDADKEMQAEMMNNLVAKCYTDPYMSDLMMGLTMNMCDIDKEMCDKMSQMMMNHPTTMQCMMKSLHEQGMIDKVCRDKAIDKIKVEEEISSRP